MIAREREREGDEFADKDQFVTPAYLQQQEELRKAEEEEKKREGERVPPVLVFSVIKTTLTPRYK